MNGIANHVEYEFDHDLNTDRATSYYVLPERFFRPELGEYRTYGIRFMCCGRTKVLHDVSTDPKTIRRIVELINRYNVSPVHLVDVVRDLLP